MRAGELNKRITIEQPVETVSGLGEPVQTWSVFAVLWAGIQPLVGSERVQAAQVNANADVKVTIRYYFGILPSAKMRIRFKDRVLQIAAPPQNINESNRECDLLCIEQSA
jgi:SPP1 family predicted phage head-tail adaptor